MLLHCMRYTGTANLPLKNRQLSLPKKKLYQVKTVEKVIFYITNKATKNLFQSLPSSAEVDAQVS